MLEEHITLRVKRIGITAFVVLAGALFLYFLMFRSDVVGKGISDFFAVLSPIIYGFVFAYVLNPPMHVLENLTLKIYAKRKKIPGRRALKVIRLSCSILALLIMLLIVYALFALLLPEVINSIQSIVANVPVYSTKIQNWYNSFVNEYALNESSKEMFSTVLVTAQDWVSDQFMPQFNGLISRVTSSVVDILVFFKNVLLGLIVSIYVMVSQDSILARTRRIIYAIFNVATANQILKNLRFVDEKFGGFLIGKIIDSAIIGVICYIGAIIMNLPYALLIAVVVGVTNIIPFFGPFIGAIPSAILIWCVDPMDALYFVIFVLVLQQFDGNLLGPKILGNSVGVSSFMVLVAILIGGGLFGFFGMIVGVPLCAILTSILQTYILRRIANKDLPGEIEAYHHMEKLDPWKRQIIQSQPDMNNASLYTKISQRSKDIADFCIKLENNPWDRTAEEVERERVQYKAEWSADREYCTKYANKNDHYDVKIGEFSAQKTTDSMTNTNEPENEESIRNSENNPVPEQEQQPHDEDSEMIEQDSQTTEQTSEKEGMNDSEQNSDDPDEVPPENH